MSLIVETPAEGDGAAAMRYTEARLKKITQMAFLDDDMKWVVEKGEYQVQIGHSSEDICQSGSYRVTSSRYIEGHKRGFYCIGGKIGEKEISLCEK